MEKNEQAFLHMVNENQTIIIRYCLLYVNDIISFEDLYQETLYNLWKSFQSFRGDCKPSTWIYRVTINTCISSIRINKKMKFSHDYKICTTGDADYSDEDNKEILYTMINQLPLIDRSIVLLWLDGNKYSEISEMLDMSENNVAIRLNRAKNKLKIMYNKKNK